VLFVGSCLGKLVVVVSGWLLQSTVQQADHQVGMQQEAKAAVLDQELILHQAENFLVLHPSNT